MGSLNRNKSTMKPHTKFLLYFIGGYSAFIALLALFPSVVDGKSQLTEAYWGIAFFFSPAIGISRFFQLQTNKKIWRYILGLSIVVPLAFACWIGIKYVIAINHQYFYLNFVPGMLLAWAMAVVIAGYGGIGHNQHKITRTFGKITLILAGLTAVLFFSPHLLMTGLAAAALAATCTVATAAITGYKTPEEPKSAIEE